MTKRSPTRSLPWVLSCPPRHRHAEYQPLSRKHSGTEALDEMRACGGTVNQRVVAPADALRPRYRPPLCRESSSPQKAAFDEPHYRVPRDGGSSRTARQTSKELRPRETILDTGRPSSASWAPRSCQHRDRPRAARSPWRHRSAPHPPP
jgi:hypothetical protein